MRIHRLMVSLLPVYCSQATWKQLVTMLLAEETGELKDSVSSEEVFIVAQKICCNVVDYARAAMTMGSGMCNAFFLHLWFSRFGYLRPRPSCLHFLCSAQS